MKICDRCYENDKITLAYKTVHINSLIEEDLCNEHYKKHQTIYKL